MAVEQGLSFETDYVEQSREARCEGRMRFLRKRKIERRRGETDR